MEDAGNDFPAEVVIPDEGAASESTEESPRLRPSPHGSRKTPTDSEW